jgi:hypothetical protein
MTSATRRASMSHSGMTSAVPASVSSATMSATRERVTSR